MLHSNWFLICFLVILINLELKRFACLFLYDACVRRRCLVTYRRCHRTIPAWDIIIRGSVLSFHTLCWTLTLFGYIWRFYFHCIDTAVRIPIWITMWTHSTEAVLITCLLSYIVVYPNVSCDVIKWWSSSIVRRLMSSSIMPYLRALVALLRKLFWFVNNIIKNDCTLYFYAYNIFESISRRQKQRSFRPSLRPQ